MIRGIRLINGDELVGDINIDDIDEGGAIPVKNPVGIKVFAADESKGAGKNDFQLVFYNYLPLKIKKEGLVVDEPVMISEGHILLTYELTDEVVNMYNQMFGSGIVLARNIPNLNNLN